MNSTNSIVNYQVLTDDATGNRYCSVTCKIKRFNSNVQRYNVRVVNQTSQEDVLNVRDFKEEQFIFPVNTEYSTYIVNIYSSENYFEPVLYTINTENDLSSAFNDSAPIQQGTTKQSKPNVNTRIDSLEAQIATLTTRTETFGASLGENINTFNGHITRLDNRTMETDNKVSDMGRSIDKLTISSNATSTFAPADFGYDAGSGSIFQQGATRLRGLRSNPPITPSVVSPFNNSPNIPSVVSPFNNSPNMFTPLAMPCTRPVAPSVKPIVSLPGAQTALQTALEAGFNSLTSPAGSANPAISTPAKPEDEELENRMRLSRTLAQNRGWHLEPRPATTTSTSEPVPASPSCSSSSSHSSWESVDKN